MLARRGDRRAKQAERATVELVGRPAVAALAFATALKADYLAGTAQRTAVDDAAVKASAGNARIAHCDCLAIAACIRAQ